MDLEAFKFIFQVVQFFLTGGIGIYVYLSNKDKVTNDRITHLEDDLDTKLDTQIDRIARLESASTHALNHGDLGSVYERVSAVDQRLARLEGEFKSQGDTLRLILNQITQKGMQ